LRVLDAQLLMSSSRMRQPGRRRIRDIRDCHHVKMTRPVQSVTRHHEIVCPSSSSSSSLYQTDIGTTVIRSDRSAAIAPKSRAHAIAYSGAVFLSSIQFRSAPLRLVLQTFFHRSPPPPPQPHDTALSAALWVAAHARARSAVLSCWLAWPSVDPWRLL
jgi:hypothetical protein